MKTYPPNFGGWLASTEKEPHKLLHTIWERARKNYTGLVGIDGLEENLLVFTGIQIRIKNKEPMSDDLGYPLALEITDGKRIQPEFFDLWEYLKANHYVYGGADEEDSKFFSDGGKGYKDLEELDLWVNKYSSRSKAPRISAESWLQKEDAPSWISYKKIQRRRQERERRWGEKFEKNYSADKKPVR